MSYHLQGCVNLLQAARTMELMFANACRSLRFHGLAAILPHYVYPTYTIEGFLQVPIMVWTKGELGWCSKKGIKRTHHGDLW